jgi:hypothetical protein
METWFVNKTEVRRRLMIPHDYKPSIKRLFRDAGIEDKYQGSPVWSHEITTAIASQLGCQPEDIASRGLKQGRPPRLRARMCPKTIHIPQELRDKITEALTRSPARGAGEWIFETLERASRQ